MMDDFNAFYEERPRNQGGPLLGIVVFALAMVMLLFVAPYVTEGMGAWGTVVSEMLLAILPIAIALILRMDMKEVFPFRAIQGRQLGGTLLLWMGSFGMVMMVMMLIISIAPHQLTELTETGNGISAAYGNLSFLSLLLIMAVSPAICEEILTRGLMQYTFGRLNKWVCIFLTGILFGVMHLDPLRIAATSLLGIMLAYLRYKTGNLWLPMIFHFVHNSVSALSVYYSGSLALITANAAISPDLLTGLAENGSMYAFTGFFFGMGAPFLILAGLLLLEPPRPLGKHRYREKRPLFILATAATVIIALGMLFSLANMMEEGDWEELTDSSAAAICIEPSSSILPYDL